MVDVEFLELTRVCGLSSTIKTAEQTDLGRITAETVGAVVSRYAGGRKWGEEVMTHSIPCRTSIAGKLSSTQNRSPPSQHRGAIRQLHLAWLTSSA